MTTNEEEETAMDFDEFEEWYQWRQADPKYVDEARKIWDESISHGLQEVESRFNHFLAIQRWGGILINTRRNIKVHIKQLRTISFVVDFTQIPKIWSKEPMPRHFHMTNDEFKLCLNYEKTNRKLYRFIYNNILRTIPWIQEVVIASVQCTYIEVPLSYAVRPERIRSRSYGVRIRDDLNKYHNYLLMYLPEGMYIDGHSLSPVNPGYYSDPRYTAFHSLADTIPLICGYQRPINSCLGGDFAGPGLMKITYKRRTTEPLPENEWFHRFVYKHNHVSTFNFQKIEEILFGDKPISKAVFAQAIYQLLNYREEIEGLREYHMYTMRNNLNRPDLNYDNYSDPYLEEINTKKLIEQRSLQWLAVVDQEGEELAVEHLINYNRDRFERYNMIYHKFVIPGYHYVQTFARDEERPVYKDTRYNSDYKLLPVQLVPYYRKVDIIHEGDGDDYWESDHDPGRVYPFVSYCDKSFVYCFNSGWDHIYGYFTATVIADQSKAPRLGDSAYNEQYKGGIHKVNIVN